jgi:ribosomal protein L22
MEKTEDKKIIEENKDTKLVETEKKQDTKKHAKKNGALVNGRDVPISTKYAIALCNMIRNKNIDKAMSLLELAEKMKIAVPMRGEIAHKSGMMSGRYPVKAAGHFIILIKSLKSNALVNELELEKYKIACKANVAPRPYRRFGTGQFKRTHVELKLIPIKNNKQ